MARGRSKRKFYPEFYTDEELESQNKNAESADGDTDTSSADGTEIIEGEKSEKSAESASVSEAPEDDVLSTVQKTSNGTRKTAKSAKTATKTVKTAKTSRQSAKKADPEPTDKNNISADIKEKLYPATQRGISKTSEAMFRRLDDMQRDYIEQKFAVSSTEVPNDYGDMIEDEDTTVEVEAEVEYEENQNTEEDEYIEENIEEGFEENEEESLEGEYNDYPFEDEPYKIMNTTDIENAEPYNDNPYEDADYDDEAQEMQESTEADDADDADDLDEPDVLDEFDELSDGEYISTMELMEEERETEEPEETVTTEREEIIAAESNDSNDSNNNYDNGNDPLWKKYNVPNNIIPFDREKAIKYAHRWALDRNPDYLNFDELGGDCTNYISQILIAGGCPMDKTPVFGWYYTDGNDKSPSWTGVEQLYNYLIKDRKSRIVAREIELSEVEAGDIVQMSFNGKNFQHTPFIVSVARNPDGGVSYENIKICAHSFDSENRPLDTYKWRNIRFIRIFGHM